MRYAFTSLIWLSLLVAGRVVQPTGSLLHPLTSMPLCDDEIDPMKTLKNPCDGGSVGARHIHFGHMHMSRPVHIVLQFVAGGGLCNQLYSFLSVLAIANTLRAHVVLPRLHTRASFQHQRNWTTVPPDSIFNLQKMSLYWTSRNVTLIQVSMT